MSRYYYFPRNIKSQQSLDYVNHWSVSQFSYVQAHDAPKHEPLITFTFRPILNQQGGHYPYNLSTHDYITWQYVTVIPITTTVIEAVEHLSKADGLTSFVLQDKTGIKFHDSTSIAGVDHSQTDANQFDNIFRDPGHIQIGKSNFVDDHISEQESDNLKKDREDQNVDEYESIDDEEKSIHQNKEQNEEQDN